MEKRSNLERRISDGLTNYKLTIEYDGTDYNGWQVQNFAGRSKGPTVQGVLEDALEKIFTNRIKLTSSSRTDSGVHAKAHAANFKVVTSLEPHTIKKALNSYTPNDILVKKVERVSDEFNAQHSVKSKVYRYVIYNGIDQSPFSVRYAYHFKQRLSLSLMRKEAGYFLGSHDFTSFKSSHGGVNKPKDSKRTIKRVDIKKRGSYIVIDLEADGFLYYMARNIVGTLIEVGRGKFSSGSVRHILSARDRRLAGPTAPAKALTLIKVQY